jgi:tetratricopeptide (TPR) repeat protein
VADRLVVDLNGDGKATVMSWRDKAPPEVLSQTSLTWPLDAATQEDLRWYLEDYLLAPYGVWEERGPAIRDKLSGWGEQVFGAVFGTGPARDAYQRARDKGLEVLFRSADPGLLGLPWELMRDGAGPVALGKGGISRSLPASGGAQTLEVSGGRLRVLMVISRPAGTRDVGYQMVARPLLERLAAVRGEVSLTVLRPPTFDALREALTTVAEPFHVVHFDGHGVMPNRPAGGGMVGGRPTMMTAAEGLLAFERPGGGSENVGASKLAQVLVEGRVPVVVLNACQSGAVGKELEASVATALLNAGCAAVVAMAYTVYAVAAAEFMAAFYETLFTGATVSQAVTAGRKQLALRNERPSPKGDMPLADWLIPVHYLREDVSFPQARTPRPANAPSLEAVLDEIRTAPDEEVAAQDPLAAVGTFVGRDDLLYELEVAARLQRVVVLSGPGGTGKTELAKGFARWLRDTGGVDDPRLVLWHSFEPGVATFGLDGVINAIGLAVFGTDFARLDPPDRLKAVKELLARYRALLVWDNFESVREMPDPTGATPPLDDSECAALKAFLDWVRDQSVSTVIITSRTREDWLGQVRRRGVGGLDLAEAAQYAGHLLAPYPSAQPRREQRSFGELLEWLDGHPLSMRLTLPRLDSTDPRDLLAGLRGTTPLPAADDPDTGRTTSLPASITYSYAHLSVPTRRLLPAVSLFHGVADEDVLAAFSAIEGLPDRFAGVTKDEWTAVLEDASRVGLLTGLGAGMYRIHPALPGYLAAGWRAENPADYDREQEACEQALCTACAVFSRWLTGQIKSGDAAFAYAIIGLQRRTLGAMLGQALDRHAWTDADSLVRALDPYWGARGLGEEAAAWADRILDATANLRQTLIAPASELWLYTTIEQATRQKYGGHPDLAAQSYRRALTYLQDQPETGWTRANIAVLYHQIGMTAEERGRLDEAEDWYRKSLTIKEELGNAPGMAITYHQLGITAQDRGRLGEAEDWYRKSLTIEEELGNRPGMASTYHQLGMTAEDRGRLDEAEDWYRKALTIDEELGNAPGMALTYGQLGNSAQHRGHLDETEDWYRKALTIFEELGNRPGMASAYHQLGITAQARGQLDEADDWYRKSLTIEEELGNAPGMAISYAALGILAEHRGQAPVALEWNIRCVTLFDEFPSPLTGTGPSALARLTRQLGIPALKESWQQVTGHPVPQAVLDYITNYQDDDQPPGGTP